MKKLTILFFAIAMTIVNCYSQCEYNIKKIADPNSPEVTYFIKKICGFAGRKEVLYINISKKKDKYYFNGYIDREYSRKFEIPNNCPLIFGFGDSLDIILYPALTDSSKLYAIDDAGLFWSHSGSVIYEITEKQLKYLSDNVPTNIRFHYFSDQINPKYTDKYGTYWPLNTHLKLNYKRFLKVVKCALNI